ncbi:MAG: hypothetical protein LC108_06190 [Anaerolineales bacterium]|nr:hypothetical protein [Anaerolineales bacterium]
MQELKVFIVIEGDKQKDELRIDGNLETLRAFLLGVGLLEPQPVPELPTLPKPRKSAKEAQPA